jgi:hypothetical protein
MRGIVPIEVDPRWSFLEADVLRLFDAGYGVECFKPISFDLAHVKMGLAVVAGEEANELDRHVCPILPLRIPKPLTVQGVTDPAFVDIR